MKTLEELVKQEPIFLDFFENEEDVFIHYMSNEEERVGVNILFAQYEDQFYEGYSFVIFEKNGQLYEVNGSHCSCYGLENQWVPELVSLKELENRIKLGFGKGYGENCNEKLIEFFGINIGE